MPALPAIASRLAARPVGLGVALVCLLLAGYLALTASDENHVKRANELGRAGHYAAAIREVEGVKRAPAASRARLTEAYAQLLLGHRHAALEQFRAAAHLDPNNYVVHRDWAFALLVDGQRARARKRMAQALALNPRMTLPPGFAR